MDAVQRWRSARRRDLRDATAGLADVRLVRPAGSPSIALRAARWRAGVRLRSRRDPPSLSSPTRTRFGPADRSSFRPMRPGHERRVRRLSASPRDHARLERARSIASIALRSQPRGTRLDSPQSPRIAVLLPCYNEEAAIARDRARLPRRRCLPPPSTSTTTTAATGRARSRPKPAPWCAASASRARAMSSGACSPTSMPTSTSWPTAT